MDNGPQKDRVLSKCWEGQEKGGEKKEGNVTHGGGEKYSGCAGPKKLGDARQLEKELGVGKIVKKGGKKRMRTNFW